MALQFSSYASNPFSKQENPGEAKIAKMKEAQEARRSELNEKASIYEAKYKEQLLPTKKRFDAWLENQGINPDEYLKEKLIRMKNNK